MASTFQLPSTCPCRHLSSPSAPMKGYSSWPAQVSLGNQVFVGGVFDGSSIWLVPYFSSVLIRVSSVRSVTVSLSDKTVTRAGSTSSDSVTFTLLQTLTSSHYSVASRTLSALTGAGSRGEPTNSATTASKDEATRTSSRTLVTYDDDVGDV